MNTLSELIHRLRDVPALVQAVGYAGMAAIIFAETGLFIGFFLPGDSLMVSAGLLCERGYLSLVPLGCLLTAASIIGDTVGYTFGHATGPRLFSREDSLLFHRKHLVRAHDFYERHGGKTIIIARFMPIIRTFAPVVAGIGGMKYTRFLSYSVIGGVLWVWSMLLIGFFLSRYVPGIATHIDIVVVVIVLLSISPAIIGRLKSEKRVS